MFLPVNDQRNRVGIDWAAVQLRRPRRIRQELRLAPPPPELPPPKLLELPPPEDEELDSEMRGSVLVKVFV
jgi:hypothetical protein